MKKVLPLAVILLTLLLAACQTQRVPVGQLSVSPDAPQLVLDDSLAFSATDASGTVFSGSQVSWASSNPSVASINGDGLATGLGLGDTEITASVGGQKSKPVKLTVIRLKKGLARVYAPTPADPTQTIQLPVVVYKDYALYQGDIAFPLSEVQTTQTTGIWPQGNPMTTYQNIFGQRLLWPNKTLPYVFASDIPQSVRDLVKQAAGVYKSKTSISLVESSPNNFNDYVSIELSNQNCVSDSEVGRKGGKQVIHFSPCLSLRTVLHEFGHALGLWHEQARSDRNSYITVLKNNIIGDFQDQYDITPSDAGFPDGPYDYGSVMHYGTGTFAKNGLPTFQLVNPKAYDISKIGTQNTLSQGDVLALNTLYGLPVTEVRLTVKPQTSGSVINGGSTALSVTVANNGPATLGAYFFAMTASPSSVRIVYSGNNLNCKSYLGNDQYCYLNGNIPPKTFVKLSGFRVEVPDTFSGNSVRIFGLVSPNTVIPLDSSITKTVTDIPVLVLQPDALEVNDTLGQASPIAADDNLNSYPLTLHLPSDLDFFKFTLPAPGQDEGYYFSTYPQDTNSLEVQLYDGNGNLLKTQPDMLLITQAGSYAVRVSGSGVTRYTASLFRGSTKIPNWLTQINTIPIKLNPGGPVEHTLINPADYFSVQPNVDSSVARATGDNLKLALFDINGNKVADGQPGTGGQVLQLPVGTGAEYFVQVTRAQDTVDIGGVSVDLPAVQYNLGVGPQ